MKLRFNLLGAIVLLFGMLLPFCSYAAQNIRIVFAAPFTGPLTQYGDMLEQGARTAVEKVNATGGVNGKKLEIIKMDDACEPKQAPSVANRVVNQKIKFVVGHACSGPTVAAAEIYDSNSVVMITPIATSPIVTDGKNFDFIFRTIGRDDQQGPAAAEFIMKELKPKKIAMLHDKRSFGQGIAEAVRKSLQNAGMKVAMFEGIEAGDSDYSAVITSINSLGADLVYFGGYHPELGLLLRQSAEQGLKARFVSDEAAGNSDLIAIAGDAVEGLILMMPADMTKDPANAGVVKSFLQKGRDPSGVYQLTSYSALMAIVEAIKAVGEDPESVSKWLHSNVVSTPIGKLSWNKLGDLNEFKFDAFVWHKDGSKSLYK